jgi:hypothetical protein
MLLAESLTERVSGLAIEVHRNIGPGLFESVCKQCLYVELRRATKQAGSANERKGPQRGANGRGATAPKLLARISRAGHPSVHGAARPVCAPLRNLSLRDPSGPLPVRLANQKRNGAHDRAVCGDPGKPRPRPPRTVRALTI